jgi:hypothetical protein
MTKNIHFLSSILLVFTFLLPIIVSAQADARACHANHIHEQHIAEYPHLKLDKEAFEREWQQYRQAGHLQSRGASITIPVVVHIVYSNETENVSDAQVRSQIEILNKDFNKANSEVGATPSVFADVVADCGINFQLATRDPQGKPTTGIVRYGTTKTVWAVGDDIKVPSKGGFAPWSASKYLNIYVANLASKSLGFSSFPGAPDNVDGVVISYKAFGFMGKAVSPYNLGRTAVHEVGHWLGLYHIWGDADCGNDQVEDTPVHKKQNGGCPAFPQINNCTGGRTIEMTMNFMDYVYDNCMYLFTNGQKERMWATLEKRRSGLFTSDGTQAANGRGCTIKGIEVKNVEAKTALVQWEANAGVARYIIEYRENGQGAWKTEETQMPYIQLDTLKNNMTYEVRIKTDCMNTAYSNPVKFTTAKEENSFAAAVKKEILVATPNPVQTVTELLIGGDQTKPFTLTIYDASGFQKMTESYKADTPSVFLDFSSYPQGMYFVVMVKNGYRVVKKIVH